MSLFRIWFIFWACWGLGTYHAVPRRDILSHLPTTASSCYTCPLTRGPWPGATLPSLPYLGGRSRGIWIVAYRHAPTSSSQFGTWSRGLHVEVKYKVKSPVFSIQLYLPPQGALGKTMSRLRLIIGSTSILLVTNMSFLTTGVRNSANRVITRREMH